MQSSLHHAMNPDPYSGLLGANRKMYVRDVQEIIRYGTTGHIAAFICEAIQGVGGIVELAPGYLSSVYDVVKEAGCLFIVDEVQSGFTHTRSHFWGFESHGVVPYVVAMAKICSCFMCTAVCFTDLFNLTQLLQPYGLSFSLIRVSMGMEMHWIKFLENHIPKPKLMGCVKYGVNNYLPMFIVF